MHIPFKLKSFCAISRSQIEILTNFQCKIPIFKNFAPSPNLEKQQDRAIWQYRTTVTQQESAIFQEYLEMHAFSPFCTIPGIMLEFWNAKEWDTV